MRAVLVLFRRITGLLGRSRRDRDLEAELEAHLAMHVEDHIRSGMTPEEARRSALIKLGGLAQTRERVRDRRSLPFLDALAQDLRYGARMLRRGPGFTAVAVATLALGIGANSAVFSVVNAVLLRPLPFPEPERLVAFANNESLPDLDDIASRSRSFEMIGGVNVRPLDFTGGEAPVQVTAGLCTARYFDTFGVRAEQGRALTDADDRSRARVVVLSREFWEGRLGGDPAAIGKAIPLSGNPYTVVGILGGSSRFPGPPADLWVPIHTADPLAADFRGVHFLRTILRLRPGIPIGRAQAEIGAIDRWLERAYPEENRGRRRELEPLREGIVGGSRRTLLILFSAVGLVLLIACANFAGLLLARASVRQREMTIRGALGAGTGRLVRQLLTESLLLATLGGAAGLGLARLGIRALLAFPGAGDAALVPVRVDATVFAFTAAIALLTGLVFGLVPALAGSRVDLNRGLRESSRGASGTRRDRRVRRALVVSEIALAVVLLTGAGLLLRSFRKLREVEPGFRPEHVLTLRVELPAARYEKISRQRLFRARLLDSVNEIPGVRAAYVSELPMSGESLTHNFVVAGRPPVAAGEEPEVLTRTVSAGYFPLLGIPLRRGRDFSAADTGESPLVAIVNDSFVRRYFPGEDPIGARVAWAHQEPPSWMTIVGVAGDVNHFGPARPEEPAVYDLYSQTPQPWKRWMYLVVRSASEPGALVREVTARLWALDRQLPPTRIREMTEVVAGSTASQKFNLILLGAFAALALALASIGIYGLVAYSVAQQRREIGVRMALGADAASIVRLILADGLRLAAAGGAIGLAGAFLLTRLMTSLLFGVGARDPQTLFGVVLLLGAVSAAAAYIPARWATRVDPVAALRVD